MSNVLSVRRVGANTWTDMAAVVGDPTEIDGWWDSAALERDSFAIAGEDGVQRSESARGSALVWTPELLIAADSPGARAAKVDAVKRLMPLGLAVEFKLHDASRYRTGTVDRIAPVTVIRSRLDDWEHGDALLRPTITFHDPALYDETATVESVAANTAKKVNVGTRPHRFTFVAPGSFSGITIEAYDDDGTGTAPVATPYASLVLSTAPGSGDSLTIDPSDTPILDDSGVKSTVFGDITSGWFFRLGQGLGETVVWFKSTRAGTLTYRRKW